MSKIGERLIKAASPDDPADRYIVDEIHGWWVINNTESGDDIGVIWPSREGAEAALERLKAMFI